MKFDGSQSEFTIVDVLRITRDNDPPMGYSGKRPIGYLSCRLSGWSELEFPEQMLRLDTEHCLLCPAFTEYTHHYYKEELITIHLDFTKNPPKEVELIYNNTHHLKEEFLQLHKCFSEKQPGYQYKCKSIVYNIFYLLHISDVQQINSKIQNSIDYLYQNYLRRDFSIHEMIAQSYLSEAYFRRIFRQLYGCSIVEFVKCLRIEYAKSLIESRRYTIQEISSMVGFADEKYFSQVFRKTTGCIPTKYNR